MKIKYILTAIAMTGSISTVAFGASTTKTHQPMLHTKPSSQVRPVAAYARPKQEVSQEALARLQDQLNSLQGEIKNLKRANRLPTQKSLSKNEQQERASELLSSQDKVFGNYVVIAPYTGKPTYYYGGQLLVNAPSINEDAKLLYRRFLEERELLNAGTSLPDHPRLVLSGKVEGQVIGQQPYSGARETNVDLSGAELDTFAEVTPWVNGLMSFSYDNSPTTTGKSRVSNSKLSVDKGFVTFGNFRRSPFYGTIGQMYVPFGRYGSSMVSSPVTQYIGKTKARAISASFMSSQIYNFAPYITAFVFKGDTKYGNSGLAKNWGTDLGFWYDNTVINGDAGISYITNIADSKGMQNTGSSADFQGFEKTSSTDSERLVHRVGGFDIHATMGYRAYSLIAEYVGALQQFSESNMSFNGHGAKPDAMTFEAAYTFRMFNMPSSAAIGYGLTRQALALNLPERRYIATLQTTFLRDTTASLEFRHDINYGRHNTATGDNMSATTSSDLGRSNNAVTAQIGVYF